MPSKYKIMYKKRKHILQNSYLLKLPRIKLICEHFASKRNVIKRIDKYKDTTTNIDVSFKGTSTRTMKADEMWQDM